MRNTYSPFVVLLSLFFLFAFSLNIAKAEDNIVDGTYDASVTTDSGRYNVPVEVENGEVTKVHWPDGGNMNVRGAELDGGSAVGSNYDGDRVHIEVDDLEYENGNE